MFAARGRLMLASMSEIDPRLDTAPVNWSDLSVTDLPTGTVTLLLADVEGSTRLWETRPDEMTAAVALLDRTLSELVAAHHGVRPVEQGEGDSFVVAFARASDAVACALQLQRAPLAPMRLRIGIHTGEIQLRDEGNYIGPTINRTARLRDLAHGGQTVLSGAAEEMVLDRLPDDARLNELGSYELRGVARPERVIQLCHPDLRNEFPPLRVANVVVTQNLPAQLTSFVGRTAQLTEVGQIVATERLVTLTGAGGVGKTRLAVQVAGRSTVEFAGGIWYVDLAPITDPDLVPVTVARALGLTDQRDRATMEVLVRFIGDRHILVVLDNCEHLLDATAALTEGLLSVCPRLHLLTTSREPIGVAGEVSWRVPSLSLTDEAIQLFTDRARRARSDFTVTEDNLEAVTEICRRLDGMPLAIELAAARIRALSLDDIEDSLHDRFRLLTGGARTAVRRQQTLRASVDWSHALLTEPERVLFRRLAAFMGGFDLQAAQTVGGRGDVERYQVIDQLTLLVDKSLVVAEDTRRGTRYRLLETVRQYALEKLGESGEPDVVRGRHRDHYTAMAELLDRPAQDGHEQRIDQADIEIDNLRAAYAWSRENTEIELSSRLACSLQPLWLGRGRIREGLGWLRASVTDNEESDVPPAVRARALAEKAILGAWIGAEEGIAESEKSLAIARELDDPALLASALTARALTVSYDANAAQPYFADAIALARTLGDSWRLCQNLGWQAYAGVMAGDPIAARAAAEEGRDLAQAIGDRFELRQCRWMVGVCDILEAELVSAAAKLREVSAEAEADHDAMWVAVAEASLAHALAYLGDAAGARQAADTAIEIATTLDDFYVGVAYVSLMLAALASGDVALAVQTGETAGRNFDIGHYTVHVYLPYVAETALANGERTAARRWADQAVSMTSGWHRSLALTTRSRVWIAEGEPDAAESDLHDALAAAGDVRAYLGVPDTLECLADLACRGGSDQEAVRLLGAADAIRRRTSEARFDIYQSDCESLLAQLRNAMGDEDFDCAWAEGAALSIDEAIAYARRGRGERKRPATGWASLTPTELDVVRLVGEGLANKDIATRLFISPRTVQTHLTHVYTKMDVTSRVQLAQEAARHS
jgi:predicted ATPase/class 3 adenylate cyclase/DNA-binding CsgD family transcriptional regulator